VRRAPLAARPHPPMASAHLRGAACRDIVDKVAGVWRYIEPVTYWYVSGSRAGLIAAQLLRTVRAGLPAHTSSIGQRIRGRQWVASGTAPAVDENAGRISAGGVAAHHDVCVTTLFEVRIVGRAPACLGTLENQLFSTNSSDNMLFGRDGDCSRPPAQIPACAANAPGSHLGS
jgi:hypothetical protein